MQKKKNESAQNYEKIGAFTHRQTFFVILPIQMASASATQHIQSKCAMKHFNENE